MFLQSFPGNSSNVTISLVGQSDTYVSEYGWIFGPYSGYYPYRSYSADIHLQEQRLVIESKSKLGFSLVDKKNVGDNQVTVDGDGGSLSLKMTESTKNSVGIEINATYGADSDGDKTSDRASNASITLRDLADVDIRGYYYGIYSASKSLASGENTSQFIVNGTESLFIGSTGTDPAMQRAIMTTGNATVDIDINSKIELRIENALLDEAGSARGSNERTIGSGLVTGNGVIVMKAKDMDFDGHVTGNNQTSKDFQEEYAASYAIQARTRQITGESCGSTCSAKTIRDSRIKLDTKAFDLDTNWGAIVASSSTEHSAAVWLNATGDKGIHIRAAGTVTNEEKNYVGDRHSAIRAVSGVHLQEDSHLTDFNNGKSATITINSASALNVNYASSDLLEAETKHDLLFAYGNKAKINLNAKELVLNGEGHDLRNIAFADEKGYIGINTGTGYDIVKNEDAYQDKEVTGLTTGEAKLLGNLTARNEGTIDVVLTDGSVLDGAAFDNSFVYFDTSSRSVTKPDDRGAINMTGHGGGLWQVRPYENRANEDDLASHSHDGRLFENLTTLGGGYQYYSTINQLKVSEATEQNPFVVSLFEDSQGIADTASKQRVLISNLEGNNAQFNLSMSGDSVETLKSDQVQLHNATGTHSVYLKYDGPHDLDAPTELKDQYQWLVTDDSKGATFKLANEGGKVDIGLYKYALTHDVDDSLIGGDSGDANFWYLHRTEEVSTPVETQLSFAGSHRFLHWADLQDLRKRLGEVRYGAQDGLWARAIAQKDEVTTHAGLKQDYYGINLGYDRLVSVSEERQWLVGGSLTFGRADQEARVKRDGKGETQRYGVNAYATWAADDGRYADIVASFDWFDQEMTTRANDVQQKGDFNTWGAGLSVEVGKMFTSESNDVAWGPWYRQWWIEPQLQLSYYYLNGADYKLNNNGLRVHYKDDSSLIGRAGLVAGTKWNYGKNYDSIDRRFAQVYVKGGIKHDFLGDYDVTLNDKTFATDIGQTTVYYGLGADWQVANNTRVYFNVEREQGDDYKKQFEASIGVKINF